MKKYFALILSAFLYADNIAQEAQIACDEGYLNACVIKGIKSAMEQDYKSARAMYEKACDGGYYKGCTMLGTLYEYGAIAILEAEAAEAAEKTASEAATQDKAQDKTASDEQNLSHTNSHLKKAYELYELACNKLDGDGCTFLAKMQQHGLLDEANEAAALKSYEQACALANTDGCYELARLSESADIKRAEKIYTELCSGDHYLACTQLGTLKVEEKDYALAKTLFSKSCDHDEPSACFYLAYLHANGLGTTADEGIARSLSKKACHLGLEPACER